MKINGIVSLPHLNVRGKVKNVSGDQYIIILSEKSRTFLETTEITLEIPEPQIILKENDDIFVKFNRINVLNNGLHFENVEVYKYFENIEKEVIGKVTWWVPNDFGGILRNTGTEFIFNGNKYVDPDTEYSEDGTYYFVDVYDGQLLIEEYKNMFPPMRWFNMVNPQETYFDIIVEIYRDKLQWH